MECSVPTTSWPSGSARHSGVRTTSIYPFPKMLPDRALGTGASSRKLLQTASAGGLRACANRSWSAGRPALPAVVGPGFTDEPLHDDDRIGKGDPEVLVTRPSRSVHQRSFLWALVQELVRSTTHRFVVPRGSGAPFLEIAPSSLRSSKSRRTTLES
jgi:hypothetical protein